MRRAKRSASASCRAGGSLDAGACAQAASVMLAASAAAARDKAYGAVAKIDLPGGFHRSDIGWRVLG